MKYALLYPWMALISLWLCSSILFISRCTAFQYNETVCQFFTIEPYTFQQTDNTFDPNVKTMVRDKLFSPWNTLNQDPLLWRLHSKMNYLHNVLCIV